MRAETRPQRRLSTTLRASERRLATCGYWGRRNRPSRGWCGSCAWPREGRAGDGPEPDRQGGRETGAETLAVACPFCTVMLDDGVRSVDAGMRVADVSTLLAEAIE